MIKLMLCSTSLCLLLLASGFPHNIVGTWISSGSGASKVLLEFKSTGQFKVSVDSNIENEGRYQFKNDTFTMYDKNCGATVPGIYKINFLTADSAVFQLINDDCKDRSAEVNGGTIRRVK